MRRSLAALGTVLALGLGAGAAASLAQTPTTPVPTTPAEMQKYIDELKKQQGAGATGATPPPTTATPPAETTATPPDTTSTAAAPASATPAPPATEQPAPGAAGAEIVGAAQNDTTVEDGGLPAAIVALITLAALLSLGLIVWGAFRWWALEPRWLVRWRHAWAEALWRAAGAWGDFTDWVRIGR